jgi:hypothetical protein
MKNSNRFAPAVIILIAILIIVGSCKKETEDPVPTFTVTYDTVPLQGGGTGVQFFAKCTNNGVTMTNVTITNPESIIYVHNYNGASYTKDALFPMQGTGEAYLKQTGTWKFNLVGSSAGGKSFAIDATAAVSK